MQTPGTQTFSSNFQVFSFSNSFSGVMIQTGSSVLTSYQSAMHWEQLLPVSHSEPLNPALLPCAYIIFTSLIALAVKGGNEISCFTKRLQNSHSKEPLLGLCVCCATHRRRDTFRWKNSKSIIGSQRPQHMSEGQRQYNLAVLTSTNDTGLMIDQICLECVNRIYLWSRTL
jgi:hypothetical protein